MNEAINTHGSLIVLLPHPLAIANQNGILFVYFLLKNEVVTLYLGLFSIDR